MGKYKGQARMRGRCYRTRGIDIWKYGINVADSNGIYDNTYWHIFGIFTENLGKVTTFSEIDADY